VLGDPSLIVCTLILTSPLTAKKMMVRLRGQLQQNAERSESGAVALTLLRDKVPRHASEILQTSYGILSHHYSQNLKHRKRSDFGT
jgi:hypothetical protein